MMRSVVRATLLSLLVGGVLAGCASTPPTPPPSLLGEGPRTIALHHPASGETVTATYWRGGGYDPAALQDIAFLFRDRRSGEVTAIDPALVDFLVELRERCGATPDTPIHITSGYRTAATNAALSRTNPYVADHSYHMRGQAADIYIPGVAPRRIAEEAAALQRGGYAAYPSGHVHVDTGPFRTWTPKGSEPRTQPTIVEARATPKPTPAAKAPPKVQIAAAKPEPAPAPAPAPAPKPVVVAAAKPAESKPVEPQADLGRVRMVLAQLKEQPVVVAKDKKR